MNPILILRLLTQWEIILISALVMILIPLVFYISSMKGPTKRISVSPPKTTKGEAPTETQGEQQQ